jgi:hypothetical protein
MDYLFPAKKADPCVELNAWRFQRCRYCGWMGDVAIRKQYKVSLTKSGIYLIDGKFYGNLRDWFRALELCP